MEEDARQKIMKPVDGLLRKPVSRKEFLLHLGATAAALSGVNHIVQSLRYPGGADSKRGSAGYGSGTYGDAPGTRRQG